MIRSGKQRWPLGAIAVSGFAALGALAALASPSQAQYTGDDREWQDHNYDNRDDTRGYDTGNRNYTTSNDDGEDAPDVSFFYNELGSDGRWISHAGYGFVWSPNRVDEDWRPYTRGQWVNTEEYGWYWVSEEPWGWATYHYGRWFYDDRDGWLWVPGSTWGPAWVAWRSRSPTH